MLHSQSRRIKRFDFFNYVFCCEPHLCPVNPMSGDNLPQASSSITPDFPRNPSHNGGVTYAFYPEVVALLSDGILLSNHLLDQV